MPFNHAPGSEGYLVGSFRLFERYGYDTSEAADAAAPLVEAGKTVIMLGDEKRLLDVLAVADTLRDEASTAVDRLRKAGIKRVIMLTGDNESTAASMALQAGVDEYRASLMPEDKVDAIRELRAKYGLVAMVGDGVNDAPALALSGVGIAMGVADTDTALETADIALMSDVLMRLPFVIWLARRTVRIMKQNIALSLAIKAIILLLVVPGWLTIWLAVVGDMGTLLLVTANAMRLARINPRALRLSRPQKEIG